MFLCPHPGFRRLLSVFAKDAVFTSSRSVKSSTLASLLFRLTIPYRHYQNLRIGGNERDPETRPTECVGLRGHCGPLQVSGRVIPLNYAINHKVILLQTLVAHAEMLTTAPFYRVNTMDAECQAFSPPAAVCEMNNEDKVADECGMQLRRRSQLKVILTGGFTFTLYRFESFFFLTISNSL